MSECNSVSIKILRFSADIVNCFIQKSKYHGDLGHYTMYSCRISLYLHYTYKSRVAEESQYTCLWLSVETPGMSHVMYAFPSKCDCASSFLHLTAVATQKTIRKGTWLHTQGTFR